MEFRLNIKSSQEDILGAFTNPGEGNVIICDDDIFNYIISMDRALYSISIDRPKCNIESQQGASNVFRKTQR